MVNNEKKEFMKQMDDASTMMSGKRALSLGYQLQYIRMRILLMYSANLTGLSLTYDHWLSSAFRIALSTPDEDHTNGICSPETGIHHGTVNVHVGEVRIKTRRLDSIMGIHHCCKGVSRAEVHG